LSLHEEKKFSGKSEFIFSGVSGGHPVVFEGE
jgi:hypothetical protein